MTNTDSRELGLSSGYLQMLVQQSLLLTSYDVLISGNLSARALTLTGGRGSYSILLGLRRMCIKVQIKLCTARRFARTYYINV